MDGPGARRGAKSIVSAIPWSEYSADQVERLVAAWLCRTVPGAQRVEGSGGDDGADVYAPVDGGIRVFEIKSFHRHPLTGAQRTQITGSRSTAIKRRPDMVRWTLVLPLDLTPAEKRWFTGTLTASTTIPTDHIGLTAVEAGLAAHLDLLRRRQGLPGGGGHRRLHALRPSGHDPQ